jgi:hypothetical protein
MCPGARWSPAVSVHACRGGSVRSLTQVSDTPCEDYVLLLEDIYTTRSFDRGATFDVSQELNANISLFPPDNSRWPAVASLRNQELELTRKNPFPISKKQARAILGQVPHKAVDGTISLAIDPLAAKVCFAAVLLSTILHRPASGTSRSPAVWGSKHRARDIAR